MATGDYGSTSAPALWAHTGAAGAAHMQIRHKYMILAAYWLAGAWHPGVPVSSVRDINGNIINVGDKVSIDCTVSSIYYITPFTGILKVNSINPTLGVFSAVVDSLSVHK